MEPETENSSPELYDHSVAKPKHAALALAASFVFMGLGQLVKGHFKRFFGYWLALALSFGLLLLLALLFPQMETTRLTPAWLSVSYAVLWTHSMWDAVTRP